MDYLRNMKGFSSCFDFVNENVWIMVLKSTITKLVKMKLEYLDILKDSFLAFSLYKIIGGYEALKYFPLNFSIIVVLCFLASVVVPIRIVRQILKAWPGRSKLGSQIKWSFSLLRHSEILQEFNLNPNSQATQQVK